jgi:tripartite-type tricarboxylate transporter receptor subunit TctC
LFNSLLDLHPKLAAFQGSKPAMAALLANKVDYMCDQVVSVIPEAKAHTIRVYAVAANSRNPSLPDVPTAAEAGLPQFQASAWNALFAPKGTPRPIVEQLNAALGSALNDAGVRKALLDLGCEIPDPAERSPEALAALVRREIAKWTAALGPMGAKN